MKRLKSANGSGSVTKTDKRKPYRVRVTDWKTKKRVSLGYYETRKQAMEVLNEYLYNPYDVENSVMTFKGLYRLFIENQKGLVAKSTLKGYENSYKRCEPLHNLVFREIKGPQLQDTVNELDCSVATKKITKNFLTVLTNYAIELEIMTVNRAKFIRLPKGSNKKAKNVFTSYEIQKLWNNIETQWVDYILIMIYTGMRIGELANLKKENIDLLLRVINGGNKTEKGKHRQIPIHKDIYQLIKGLYENSTTDYLLYNKKWIFAKKENENKPIRVNYFREKFYKTLEALEMSHNPHDCRKTLATFMNNQKINSVVITDILGHEDINTTNEYYIQSNLEELTTSMDNIKFLNDVN